MDEEENNLDQEETQIIEAEIEENVDYSSATEEESPQINILENDEIIIETDTAFPPIGQANDMLNHEFLNNRDGNNQHPIRAITGLESELNNIKSLKTVYSNKVGYANYFLWEDNNVGHDNRVGLFVSLCQSENEVCIYDGTANIFGVVVDEAAFVGGQDDIVRDYKYALVTCEGEVRALCESNVAVGDHVMPNNDGVAQKTASGYGYEVAAVINNNGATYATIVLGIPANQFNALGNSVEAVNTRLDTDEINITAAINVANAAHQAVTEIDIQVQENTTKVNNAVETAEAASETAESFSVQVVQAKATAELAQSIANTAVSTAEDIRQTAVSTANQALAGVNDLIEELDPIIEWEDPTTGNTGAEYLVNYIDNGVATKVEVQTVSSLTENNISALKKSAEEFNSLISSIDNYSLGLYSQSYGLYDKAQAKSLLEDGLVYVPYDPTDPLGNYEYSEKYLSGDTVYYFTQGYYYTWTDNGTTYGWTESESNAVAFSSEYVIHTSAIPYWVPTDNVTHNDETYEKDTLYRWLEDQWTYVTNFSTNVNNRIMSSIKQNVDVISADITNAAGSFASLSERLTNQDSQINLVTTWKSTVNTNMATIGLTADDIGASIAQVVSSVGSDGQVTAASIVTAINNNETAITLNANRINLNGAVTANNNVTIGVDGKITAKAGNIGGWEIDSFKLYSVNGTGTGMASHTGVGSDPTFWSGLHDWGSTPWDKPQGASTEWYDHCYFYVKNDGSLCATKGNIGSWTISPDGIGNIDSASTGVGSGIWLDATPASGSFFINCANYGDNTKYFRVSQDGVMEASGGAIAGWEISNNKLWNGKWYNSGEVSIGMSSNPDLYAFWAGTQNKPFYVTHSGDLYAESATIKGTIQAGSIINMNNTERSNSTDFLFYNGVGFLRMDRRTNNDTLIHPYVSALNVATSAGGISFRTGSSYSDVGSQIGSIYTATNGSSFWVESNSNYNLNIKSGGNMGLTTTSGYIGIRTNSTSYSPTYGTLGSIYIIGQQSVTLHAINGYVYAGRGNSANTPIKVDSSGPSSRCLKDNIVSFTDSDYTTALSLLNDIKLYNYNYKYNISPKTDQFGFIIDELLDNPLSQKFFYFKDEKAGVTENNYLDYSAAEENPNNLPIIEFKRYDEETLIKYLLVVCKGLQKEVSDLKQELIKGE